MPGMTYVVDHFSLSQYYVGKIWKRVKRFPPTLSRRNLKKKNNHRSIWIRFWEKLGQENHMVLLCVLKCFPPTEKRKDGIFKFLMFQERFRKAPFSRSWRIRTEGSPNRRSKALFSNLILRQGVGRGFSYKIDNATVSFPDKRMCCNFKPSRP